MMLKLRKIFYLLMILAVSQTALAQQKTVDIDDIRKLVQAGQYDQARLGLVSISNNIFDLILLEVDIAVAEGRTDDAIEMLDQVLTAAPNLAVFRNRLAQILVQDKQYDRAEYQYEILRDRTEDEETRAYFNEQIQEISNIQPYDFSIQASIVPSSNINGARNETEGCELSPVGGFICRKYPPELTAQFGWRSQLYATGGYTWNFADQQSLEFGISGVVNHYSVDTLENQTARASVDYVFQDANNRFSIGPYFSRYWGDGKSYALAVPGKDDPSDFGANLIYENENYKSNGLSASYRHIIDRNSSIRLSATHNQSEYEENTITGNYKNTYGAAYSYYLDSRRSWDFSLGSAVFKQNVNGDWGGSANYRSVNFGVGYNHTFESNWFLGTSFDFVVENHNDRKYPLTDLYRQDKTYGLGIEVRNLDWKLGNSVPSLSCDASKNVSNVERLEFNSISCGIYLTNRY